ncbi:MAG: DUF4398 and OmpA-like domain-containing protein [Burkholderiales bacterium]|nr:DUF4398 and OmpA-like domain-containing protein [Burkholderiales bacterium]
MNHPTRRYPFPSLPRLAPALLGAAALAALAAMAGCSTLPADSPALDAAHQQLQAAQAAPATAELAPVELKQAVDAMGRADAAWRAGDGHEQVDHLATLAGTRAAIAQATGQRRDAERETAAAVADRSRLRLEARTDEADAAHRSAERARDQAQASQQQAANAERSASDARAQADQAQRAAAASQQQTSDVQAQADAVQARLQAELQAMNARKTDRGLVVTIGDLLFATDRAQLKPGGELNVQRLASFLNDHPQRRARIEGFTDSTGSAGHNQRLSARRADAVRAALMGLGVDGSRLATQGYGESYPVAGNDSAGGRQSNRRVEVILSDGSGAIAPR